MVLTAGTRRFLHQAEMNEVGTRVGRIGLTARREQAKPVELPELFVEHRRQRQIDGTAVSQRPPETAPVCVRL